MHGPFVNAYVEGEEVVLLRREDSGEVSRTRVPAVHAAYYRDLPEPLGRSLARMAKSVRPEGDWLRVEFRSREDRRDVCFERDNVRRMRAGGYRYRPEDVKPNPMHGVSTYEADVDPVTRHFSDTGAIIQRPKRGYLDIETDSRVPFSRKHEARVLCWAVCDDAGAVTCGMLREWSEAAEKELLEGLWLALEPLDLVAAWYGDGFDFPVICARSELLDVKADARRILFLDHLAAFKRMNMHAAESGEEKRSMALQSIAMALLGEGKDPFDASKTYEEWEAGGERRRRLLRYCIQDTRLLPKIERKTGFLDLFVTICEVCRIFPDTKGLLPTRQLDGYLLRLGMEKGKHFPSREFVREEDGEEREEEEQFKGAYVMEPKSLDEAWRKKRGLRDGFIENVHVADFASMYPGIIISWNMSVETHVPMAPVNGPVPEGCCRCPTTGSVFRVDVPGLLAEAVAEMLRLRKFWSDLKASLPPGTPEWVDADRKSNAYKVAANSFFGVSGSRHSRHSSRAVAEGITQNGVWLIRQTIHEAEKRGWEVVYTDTDSIFVIGVSREEFAEFTDWCNRELYPRLMTEQGCRENRTKIAYEKQFKTIVFTRKKRYIGVYAHYKGKAATAASKPEIKGLEYKRGDVSVLGARLQAEAVKMIVAGERNPGAYHDLLARSREHALHGALTIDEVAQAKGLNKSIGKLDAKTGKWVVRDDGYAAKTKRDGTEAASPPHVVVARMLAQRGRDVSEGTKVAYFVLDDSAIDPAKRFAPAEDFRGECDRHHVWESLVYPPTMRLLEAAFPAHAQHWAGWERSRPKAAGRASKPLPGQAQLLGVDLETRVSSLRARPEPPRPASSQP